MKNIKDYLHLYFGCPVECPIPTNQKCVITGLSGGWSGEHIPIVCVEGKDKQWAFNHTEIKLILRPLSDMTEEEATDLVKFITVLKRHETIRLQEITDNHIWYIDGEMWHGDGVSEVYDKYAKFNELTAEQFLFLLSRGFDLFGLIEANLAIDKTKISVK